MMEHADFARRARQLFEEAKLRPSGEREAFLRRACEDDALRDEVRSLLELEGAAATFLSVPALGEGFHVGRVRSHPEQVGPYHIVELLGSGGHGDVYLAEQERPIKRRVALKLIKPGMDSHAVLERFTRERQALSLMNHPNIAKVLDAGETERGHPYFVMEYVPGIPITAFAEQAALPLADRLRLLLQVCDAVEHAHRRGLIHRDLKPGNILVERHEAQAAQAKVIDFGVARSIADEGVERMTRPGDTLGTLEYMSPEQAEGRTEDIDTRSDIYALGVVLHELLTGRLPFRGDSDAAVRRAIVHDEAVAPSVSALSSSVRVPRELDWLVLKCLEKEPSRRYESVSSLKEDLRRFLASEPLQARPHSAAYRFRKFLQRNRMLVSTGALVLTAVSITGAAVVRSAFDADRAVAQADRAGRIIGMLSSTLAGFDPFWGPMGHTTVIREVMIQFSNAADALPPTEAADAASIHIAFGKSLRDRDALEDAEPQLERAMQICRDRLAPDDPTTLAAMHELGVQHRWQERWSEAQELIEHAIEGRRRVLPEDHCDTIASVLELARIRHGIGDLDSAERLYRQAVDARQRSLGRENEDTLEAMEGIAALHADQGRLDEAENDWQQILEARRAQHHAEQDLEMLNARRGLARVHHRQHRYEAAEQGYREVLELGERLFIGLQENHRDRLATMEDLGELYLEQGRYEDAETWFADALARRRKSFGAHSPHTLSDIDRMSRLFEAQGNRQEALALRRSAVRSVENDMRAPKLAMRRVQPWHETPDASPAARPPAPTVQETRTFDLEREFSEVRNPNGPWSYNQGANPLPAASGKTGARSWVHRDAGSFGVTPRISRSDRVRVNPSCDSCDANVSWTSPCAGSIDIEGSTSHLERALPTNLWRLTIGDRRLSEGKDRSDDEGADTATRDLAAGTGGLQALRGVSVRPGDTLRLWVLSAGKTTVAIHNPTDIRLRVMLHPAASSSRWFDLRHDWSDESNPNGPWSYRDGAQLLPRQRHWIETCQPAWAVDAGEVESDTAAILRKTRSFPLDVSLPQLLAGDVAMRPDRVSSSSSLDATAVAWTSPGKGVATITGHIWLGELLGSGVLWSIFHDGRLITSGQLFDGSPSSRALPMSFADGSGGAEALEEVKVDAGDEIALVVSRCKAAPGSRAPLCGVNLGVALILEQ